MWFLKDALDTSEVGVTILELEPGGKGKEHDHSGDGQEEVYVCVSGTVDIEFIYDTVTLTGDDAVRIDPGETRQIHDREDKQERPVLVGGPLE